MSKTVTFEKRGRIGIINVDNPPVNALSHAVRQGLAILLAPEGIEVCASAGGRASR